MKKVVRIAKLQFLGGQARPRPALASVGVNIGEFCNQFNKATEKRQGDVVPVVITVYSDRSFAFILKTTPVAVLIKKYAQIEKGAKNAKNDVVGSLSSDQVEEIAKYKLIDLNTDDIKQAIKIVLGTMKQMGVKLQTGNNQ